MLLVGGSTRMPMVRAYVTQMAGKPPRTGVNVDEVVALARPSRRPIEEGRPSPTPCPGSRSPPDRLPGPGRQAHRGG